GLVGLRGGLRSSPWRGAAMTAPRSRTFLVVTHGLCFLIGALLAGGVGLYSVREEERRTAAQRDRAVEAEGRANARVAVAEANVGRAIKAEARGKARLEQGEANLARAVKAEAEAKANLQHAEANFKLARKAVDDCFGVARDHPLLQGPSLGEDLHKLKR